MTRLPKFDASHPSLMAVLFAVPVALIGGTATLYWLDAIVRLAA